MAHALCQNARLAHDPFNKPRPAHTPLRPQPHSAATATSPRNTRSIPKSETHPIPLSLSPTVADSPRNISDQYCCDTQSPTPPMSRQQTRARPLSPLALTPHFGDCDFASQHTLNLHKRNLSSPSLGRPLPRHATILISIVATPSLPPRSHPLPASISPRYPLSISNANPAKPLALPTATSPRNKSDQYCCMASKATCRRGVMTQTPRSTPIARPTHTQSPRSNPLHSPSAGRCLASQHTFSLHGEIRPTPLSDGRYFASQQV